MQKVKSPRSIIREQLDLAEARQPKLVKKEITGFSRIEGNDLATNVSFETGLKNNLNSFAKEAARPFFKRGAYVWLFCLLSATSAVALTADFDLGPSDDLLRNAKFGAVNFNMDMISPRKKTFGKIIIIDEVFGNEFVKKKDDAVVGEDPRIAGAIMPLMAGIQGPTILNPTVTPKYPAAAKNAGIEGKMSVKIWIAEDGEVLKVQPLNKLGHGLERAAVNYFKHQLKWKPGFDPKSGKKEVTWTVQTLDFTLN